VWSFPSLVRTSAFVLRGSRTGVTVLARTWGGYALVYDSSLRERVAICLPTRAVCSRPGLPTGRGTLRLGRRIVVLRLPFLRVAWPSRSEDRTACCRSSDIPKSP